MTAGRPGYVRWRRGAMEHPAFAGEPFCRRQAWFWLVENAAWQETRVGIGGGQVLTLDRGQISHSLRHLAGVWGWTTGRVQRFLRAIQGASLIRLETDSGRLIVTICDYDDFRLRPSRTDSQAIQQRFTGEDKEEGKKGIKVVRDSTPVAPTESGGGGTHSASRQLNLRVFGTNPRATGGSPRARGTNPRQAAAETYRAEFAAFWAAYPLKEGEKGAFRAYVRARLAGADAAAIVAGVARYAAMLAAHPNREPLLARNFLSQERWRDEHAAATPSAAVQPWGPKGPPDKSFLRAVGDPDRR